MKFLSIALITLTSALVSAATIEGSATLKYTPHLSNTGDIFITGEMAEAVFNQLKVDVVNGGDFDAKYGDGTACFKFQNKETKCRVEIKFTAP